MVEQIPSEDQVSRHVDSPDKWNTTELRFIDKKLFVFSSPDCVESVVWRKYAFLLDDVHSLGCDRQKSKRETNPRWTYEGATTANVGAIRALRNRAADGFEVVHAPDEGVHHAHIEYRLSEGTDFLKQRKSDLKEYLAGLFSDIDKHSC